MTHHVYSVAQKQRTKSIIWTCQKLGYYLRILCSFTKEETSYNFYAFLGHTVKYSVLDTPKCSKQK